MTAAHEHGASEGGATPGRPPGTPPDAAPALRLQGLTKRFGDNAALRGVDLTAPRGAFYALLGPNGAGKSTTISILTGVYAPDAGSVSVLGVDALAHPQSVKARLGVVPEELALFERLSGRQHVTFCGRLYGLPGEVAAARADELLRLTALDSRADDLVAVYSKGMRRRLAIASALVHAPEVVLLDEPFEGIDVVAAAVIRELLRELARRGVTILLTTHVIEIADRLATHAGVIVGGRMVAEGSADALRAAAGATSLEAVLEAAIGAPASRDARLSFYAQDVRTRAGASGEPPR